MIQSSSSIPAAVVRGTASGVLFMALFGTLWAGISIAGLEGWGLPWLIVPAAMIGIGLLMSGIFLMREAGQLATQSSTENSQRWQKKRRWFRIIFATEGITMGIVSALCGATGHYELIFPLMAIIVGIHFLPLAPLFEIKAYYGIGLLLCLLSLITLLALPARATIDGQQIIAWWTVVGLGSALILWITSLFLLFQGRRLLHQGLHLHAQPEMPQGSVA